MKNFLRWMLFAAALILFLASLHVFVSARTSSLWIVALLAVEWGHYGALLALIIVALSCRRNGLGYLTTALAGAATLLFLKPALHAAFMADSLPARCTDAFVPVAAKGGRASAFHALDLFRGLPDSKVKVSDHAYTTDGKKSYLLDLYQPSQTSRPVPLVIVIHGGSWSGGSKKQLPALNRYLAHRGYAVAVPNYHHAPGAPFPAAIEDVFHAIDFLRAHGAEFQIDASRIVLLGRSAGAQIALSAAYARRDPAIRGVVDFYGPADLVLGYEHPSRQGVLDSKKVLQAYLGGAPNERSAAYHDGSAINFVDAATPPTLIIHGALDPIVWPEQSERLAAKLAAEGRPHLYLELPWASHGCDANLQGPSGQLSLYAIDRFLAACLPLAPDEK